MARNTTKDKQSGWDNQQRSDGSDSYNPSERNYQDKFNDISKREELADLEKSWNAPYEGKNGSNVGAVREAEVEPDGVPRAGRISSAEHSTRGDSGENRRTNRDVLKRVFTSKSIQKRSSLITLMLLLFGGGGFLTVFLSPSLAIVQMKEIFTKSLNDQLHSVENRSAALMRSKLKDVTKGSCGVIKIKCRFATMTDRQAEKFKRANIDIERDMSKSLLPNRGQITKMTFVDDKGVKLEINSASELHDAMLGNVRFRAATLKGYNPLFAGLSDKVALGVMKAMKTSKRVVATGDNDEERQKKVNDAVSGIEDPGGKSLTVKKDENGKEYYVDSEGNPLDPSEVEAAREQSDRITDYTKSGGMKSVLSGAVKGVGIIGAADSACTVYNSMRFVSALAKIKKKAQAARFAMAMVLIPADSIKAGDALEEDMTFIGNNLTEQHPAGTVVDESKINQPGSAGKPATMDDPDAGKNAFDGPGYQLAVDPNHVPTVNMRASRFMLGGGSVSVLSGVLAGIATIVNGGDPNPQAVSQKCHYIQNPAVRFTSLAVGIIAGIGSFGLTTALGIGGSLAIAMSLPYVESQAADIISGNMFKDLSGVDSGDAAYVGASGMFGDVAMNRGMKPLNKDEGMKVLAANQATYAQYAAAQQYSARATPFDLTNQFSFLGSIRSSLLPSLEQSKSSAASALTNVASIVPKSFSLLSPQVGAVSGDYVQWMVDNNQINPDTGDAVPTGGEAPDPHWTYAKFLNQCAHRKVGWGENQDENEGDGHNCLDPSLEPLNQHFRIYTLDRSVDESLDAAPQAAALPGTTGFDSGRSGTVSANGWAFPTIQGDVVTSGFETPERPDHRGVDLAGKSTNETRGQPIFAAYDGVVKAAGPADGFGNWIVIDHQINGKVMSTVYGHMEDDGLLVHVGDTVKAGQQIGKIGSAGEATGPHLHFEVWDGSRLGGGTAVDPLQYIGKPSGTGGTTSV
jgi:hypothetical protein